MITRGSSPTVREGVRPTYSPIQICEKDWLCTVLKRPMIQQGRASRAFSRRRRTMKARIALMCLLVLFVFGSATATASAPQPNCRRVCNEVLQSNLRACRNLPRYERSACVARARAAHRHCLRRCRTRDNSAGVRSILLHPPLSFDSQRSQRRPRSSLQLLSDRRRDLH
jgi:hypothetical protein